MLRTISEETTSAPKSKANPRVEKSNTAEHASMNAEEQINAPKHTSVSVEQNNVERVLPSEAEPQAKQVELVDPIRPFEKRPRTPANPPLPSYKCSWTLPPPPIRDDEGYGAGVSFESMIVNPYVPILVKNTTTNVRISEQNEQLVRIIQL